MKRNRILFAVFCMAMIAVASGCSSRYSRTYTRPRWAGDIYINKLEPAPIIIAATEGVPEATPLPQQAFVPPTVASTSNAPADLSAAPFAPGSIPAGVVSVTPARASSVAPVLPDRVNERLVNISFQKLEGFIWNEMGRCTAEYNFPTGAFEERFAVTPGACDPPYSKLALGQEIEVGGGIIVRHSVDDDHYPICEFWRAVAGVRVAPGFRSPKLRALGGKTYALNFTQTGASGRRPWSGTFHLNVDFETPYPNYKKHDVDWSIVAHTCYVKR